MVYFCQRAPSLFLAACCAFSAPPPLPMIYGLPMPPKPKTLLRLGLSSPITRPTFWLLALELKAPSKEVIGKTTPSEKRSVVLRRRQQALG